MEKFGIVLAVAMLVVMVLSYDRPCKTDAQCDYDECCVLNFTGRGKVCRELSEDVGEACGGPYFCPYCSHNLTCVRLDLGLDEDLHQQSSCAPPASATCQNITRAHEPVPQYLCK